jgi:hypothetical protein
MEHVLGKYIISDRPMSEEEWARERADVLDVDVNRGLPVPRFGDGRKENHLDRANELLRETSPRLPSNSNYKSK